MSTFSFWNNWPKVYQALFRIFALVFFASLLYAVSSFLWNPSPVFTWQQVQELKQQELPVYSFEVGGFDLVVPSDNHILFERWMGNPLSIHMIPLDFYLMIFSAGLIMLLSLVTALRRFWFYITTGGVVIMISGFQLEALQIFGLENKIPTITLLALVLGISLYFQFFNTTANFVARLLSFALLFGVGGLILNSYSGVLHPLRYFAINTLPVSIVLLLIFILMVSHEIVAGFVFLAGQGPKNSKSLRHFLIISAVYFINLWLTYLSRIGAIDWNFTVPSFILLIISSVLAIWGIQQRRVVYGNVLETDYFAVYFILALGSIAIACVGHFYSVADDVSLISLSDLILFAHIGYGMMFMIYVASNFLGMLAANLPVYRVLYKPMNMPYFTYGLAGLICTLALVFYNRWMVPVNHFTSGYYTSLGDLFLDEENKILAYAYYKRAHFYAPYNQHAATALARLESERGSTLKERDYLSDANRFKPTEFTLLNEANVLNLYGNSLKEILTLQDAHHALPKSGIINNNLGLAYARMRVIDSAYFYFLNARKSSEVRSSAEMNLMGLLADNRLQVDADSIAALFDASEDGVRSNALAIANQLGKPVDMNYTFPKDSVLTLFSATLLGNYITNHLSRIDTAFISQSILIASKDVNSSFREIVLVPAANACYASGQVNRAFSLLQRVIFSGRSEGRHNATLALWALDLGKPETALSYWYYALSQQRASAVANAVTLGEAGKLDEAIIAWDTLGTKGDTTVHAMAESMKRVLGGPESWFENFSQKERYQYLRYRVPLENSLKFDQLLAQITDEDLKAKAILDRSKKWFDRDEPAAAAKEYSKLQGLHLTDVRLFGDIKYFELALSAKQGNWKLLDEQIKKGITFGPYRETQRVYYAGLLKLQEGDTVSASRALEWVAVKNPYFDEGVVAAAEYFQTHGNERLKAYRLLSEALQVNPHSVKILKAYIPEALNKGFDEYAASALQTLQGLIPPSAFNQYVAERQLNALIGN